MTRKIVQADKVVVWIPAETLGVKEPTTSKNPEWSTENRSL